jgi:hypothetical protein
VDTTHETILANNFPPGEATRVATGIGRPTGVHTKADAAKIRALSCEEEERSEGAVR